MSDRKLWRELFVEKRRADEAEALADDRLELLRRAHMALLMYTQSHGTPHTELMTEMADALGLDADGNTLKELGDD